MLLTRKTDHADANAVSSSRVNSLARGMARSIPTMDRRAFLRRSGLGVGVGLAASQVVLVQRSAAQLRCSPASGPTRRLLFSMLLQRHRGNAR